ncbi:MAG: class I SAM-dependent methyltransferase [Planctomycetota bacterium]|nr:class I SAM-dependent methyltransferase [Planctomycetota bacterium]MDG2144610.1 class I SAM-dependent methyltransferase [Planctomycetota bacterium]
MQAILNDLGASSDALISFPPATDATGDLHVALAQAGGTLPSMESLLGALAPGGLLLVSIRSTDTTNPELANLRNQLWPAFHVVALYRTSGGKTKRSSLSGGATLDQPASQDGCVLALRTREHIMSPAATVEKFDQNASGWNGEPGRPGYAHFRWMRKFMAVYAELPQTDGASVLDFGCGAGWVGIEAALKMKNPRLCFFDPSPEMVRISADNARENGIQNATGRTGFGEAPPFPAEGEEPFDIVISSGVLSFSPDFDSWFEGLAKSVKPGGTLIIGDIFPHSRGFDKRRRTRPLLPVRELNGQTPEYARMRLEEHGFQWKQTSGYQLTYPVPEMMHVSQTKLAGVLNPPLLLANKVLAGIDRATGHSLASLFDSWVMHFTKPL